MDKPAEPRTLTSKKDYSGFSLKDVVRRPGTADHMQQPSRFGRSLRYPDGSVVMDKEKEK